jgi:hypothetical protein
MATLFHSAQVQVSPEVAWDFLDRYTRSEGHVFSAFVGLNQWLFVVVGACPASMMLRKLGIAPQRTR